MADYIEKGIIEDTIAELKYKVLKERFPAYAMNLTNHCFLCTYARICKRCPLRDITQDNCLGGYYKRFKFAYYKEGKKLGDFSEAVKIALKIAFLPVIN